MTVTLRYLMILFNIKKYKQNKRIKGQKVSSLFRLLLKVNLDLSFKSQANSKGSGRVKSRAPLIAQTPGSTNKPVPQVRLAGDGASN